MKMQNVLQPSSSKQVQVCKLDNPFESAKETWVTAVVQQGSSTSAFGQSGAAKLIAAS
jgi:hypothetical protein